MCNQNQFWIEYSKLFNAIFTHIHEKQAIKLDEGMMGGKKEVFFEGKCN